MAVFDILHRMLKGSYQGVIEEHMMETLKSRKDNRKKSVTGETYEILAVEDDMK
jgi:rubrerythrin